jgi:hypothetical protein
MSIDSRSVISSIPYKEDGTALLVGAQGEQGSAELEELVARALATGAAGSCMGFIATAAQTIVAVRGTTYTEPSAAAQREIVSSSTNDSSAGTGARTVRITYYDGTMAGPFTEDVTMNGTTAVATVATNIRFVESLRTLTVGSNGSNVGTITLRLLSAGATIGTISVSEGVTFWAHHYIAVGRTGFIPRIICGENGVSASMFLRSFRPLTSNAFEEQITAQLRAITAQPSQIYDMGKGLFVPGPARVALYVRPDANTAGTAHGGFTFYDV